MGSLRRQLAELEAALGTPDDGPGLVSVVWVRNGETPAAAVERCQGTLAPFYIVLPEPLSADAWDARHGESEAA